MQQLETPRWIQSPPPNSPSQRPHRSSDGLEFPGELLRRGLLWSTLCFSGLLLSMFLLGCTGGQSAVQIPKGTLPDVPLEGRTFSSLLAFDVGPQGDRGAMELYPMLSEEGMYGERWDLLIYHKDFDLRVKFDITNIGLANLKGRVRGHYNRRKDGKVLERFGVHGNYEKGDWKLASEGFNLTMGKQSISGSPGKLRLVGEGKHKDRTVEFEFDIDGKAWRPGSGWVFFGKENKLFYKVSHLATVAKVKARVKIDGEVVESDAIALGFHKSSNIGPHKMADRSLYFRKLSDDKRWMLEWRYIETSETYDRKPIGHLVLSYDGVIVYESTDLSLKVNSLWTDDEHYGYVVPSAVRISATSEEGDATFSFQPNGPPNVKDPLGNLSSMEQFIAKQIAKPMDYEFKGKWRLDLKVFGERVTLTSKGDIFSVQSYR